MSATNAALHGNISQAAQTSFRAAEFTPCAESSYLLPASTADEAGSEREVVRGSRLTRPVPPAVC